MIKQNWVCVGIILAVFIFNLVASLASGMDVWLLIISVLVGIGSFIIYHFITKDIQSEKFEREKETGPKSY